MESKLFTMKIINFQCIKYSMFFSLIVFVMACKKGDWYDVKMDKSLTIPSTLKDMQALLDNVGVLNDNYIALGEIGSDGHFIKDSYASRLRDTEFNAYTWTYDKPYIAVPDWAFTNDIGAYPRIYYCNLVLDLVHKVSINSDQERDQMNNVIGQSLFLRAQDFYNLAQVYSPPYFAATAANDLSIPLRLESDINIPSRRSTVKKTYEQIISDLLLAKTLLPNTPLYKTRASKPAAFALLARTYLCMGDYINAGAYADSCLTIYSNLIDYNTLDTTVLTPFPIFNPEVIFHSRMIYYSSVRSAMFIDPELYALFDKNDLRKVVFFNVNSAGDITAKDSYTGGTLLFSGIATDELYLIRAECNARVNNINAAMRDLNKLLRSRWKAGFFRDFIATDSTDALRKILIERKKELLLRGVRWSDLKRLNQDERFKVTLTRTIGDKTYTLEPGSYRYALPLPDDILQMTGMPQNLGWK
jgi:tetratricopeptide (TPR) repeat protein